MKKNKLFLVFLFSGVPFLLFAQLGILKKTTEYINKGVSYGNQYGNLVNSGVSALSNGDPIELSLIAMKETVKETIDYIPDGTFKNTLNMFVLGQENLDASKEMNKMSESSDNVNKRLESIVKQNDEQFNKIYSSYDSSVYKKEIFNRVYELNLLVKENITKMFTYRIEEMKRIELNGVSLVFSSSDYFKLYTNVVSKYNILLKDFLEFENALKINKVKMEDVSFHHLVKSFQTKYMALNSYCISIFDMVDNSILMGTKVLEKRKLN